MTASRIPTEARPPRMDALARLPVFYALAGKRGDLWARKPAAASTAELLSAAAAEVDVLATDPSDQLLAVAAHPPQGAIVLHLRPWDTQDFVGAALAVGAFEDAREAERFAAAARAAGVPVNVIDKPAYCDFSFGAIVNRSPLVIGVSTDGAAPVFAQAIRAKIEALIPRGFGSGRGEGLARRREIVRPVRERRRWQIFTAHGDPSRRRAQPIRLRPLRRHEPGARPSSRAR